MTERPLILSGDNVQLAYEGLKTATRRLMNPQPGKVGGCYHRPDGNFIWTHLPVGQGVGVGNPFPCPYGQPGDLLWVKETWRTEPLGGGKGGVGSGVGIGYKAGPPGINFNEPDWSDLGGHSRWRSPRFMFKWAARTWLEITSVKVERLQDISADDARAEGIGIKSVGPASDLAAQNQFALLWNQIHKKAAKAAGVDYAWDLNPWVWAIGFRRTERPA